MNWVAVILAIVACVLFVLEAYGKISTDPRPWRFGWLAFAMLTVSLIIWHTVAGLEPVFNK